MEKMQEFVGKSEDVFMETKAEVGIHEAALGKGIAAALNHLRSRGALKEAINGGDGGNKEIRIERRDEFGQILTQKEAFRRFSHKFHGKAPGKRKQEKRLMEETKMKKMRNDDTTSLSVERMREAQAKLQSPYLVL